MFLCSSGDNVASKLFLFPSILSVQTGSLRIHLFQPRYYHPSTTSPRHTNMFCRLSRKNFACCFLVQSRPNTIANQQRIVIWHYEGLGMRLVMTCPALRQGIGPFEDLSVLTKICTCPTSRSHLFLRLFDKMYLACNADQS